MMEIGAFLVHAIPTKVSQVFVSETSNQKTASLSVILPRMPKKIPRGVILDLLDMYDLEIEVLYIVLEYDAQSYKLNHRFKELKDVMRSLVAKWNIGPESKGRIRLDTFYIPFHDHDLNTENDARSNATDYESELDWGPQEIMEKMHATRKLIKEVLDSEVVDDDETRDEKMKDIIEGTKRDLPEIVEEAKHMLGLRARRSASQPDTRREVHVDRKFGIYCIDNDIKKFYPKVKPGSQIFKTLLYLVEQGEPVGIDKLASNTGQVTKSVKRSIREFNEKFRIKFNVKADPMVNTGTGLYSANLEKFNFL